MAYYWAAPMAFKTSLQCAQAGLEAAHCIADLSFDCYGCIVEDNPMQYNS